MHKDVVRVSSGACFIKHFLVLSSFLAVWLSVPQEVEARRLGVGVGRGSRAAGLSVRSPGSTAIQLNAGWWDRGGFGFNIDGLLDYDLASGKLLSLNVELGVGAGLGFGDQLGAAASLIGGLRIELVPIPIDLSIELRPTLDILPNIELEPVYLGGHIRVYF